MPIINKKWIVIFNVILFCCWIILTIIWVILNLNFGILIGIVLSSVFLFSIIYAFFVRKYSIDKIKEIYIENPNLSIEEISKKSGSGENFILYVISKMECKEKSLKPKVIVGKRNFTSIKKEKIISDKKEEYEIKYGKIEINKKCYLFKSKNKLIISVDKSESKSTLYTIVFFLILFLISTLLFIQIPITLSRGWINILLIIAWILMSYIDGLIVFSLSRWFYNRNRILEFEIDNTLKEICQRKVSPKFKLLRQINYFEVNSLLITRFSNFNLKLVLENGKNIKLFESNKFSKCRDFGIVISNFLNVDLNSKIYEGFIGL